MQYSKTECMQEKERYHIANKVSSATLLINVVLSVVKVIAGITAHSNAMLADGVHTVSDVVTTVAVMIGMKVSTKPDDKEHPYGHEKIEAVVAKMLSLVLMATAFGIGYSGVRTILNGEYSRPGMVAIIAAILSIFSKEAMYRYTVKAANKINSTALKADAWHHRSDALSSIGTLIGIGGARLGITVLDPIASLVVCVLIVKVGIDIFIQSFNQLVDRAADEKTIESIKQNIWSVEGVKNIDEIKTRIHGAKIYVDVEIAVESSNTVGEGHEIAENVHNCIEESIENVKHCMVHVNPYKIKNEL